MGKGRGYDRRVGIKKELLNLSFLFGIFGEEDFDKLPYKTELQNVSFMVL